MKRTFKVIITLVLIAGIGYFGYTALRRQEVQAESSAQGSSYSMVDVTTGSLSQSVVSTGSLTMKNTLSVKAPLDITVDSILVEAGDAVHTGDKLLEVNIDALSDSLALLEDELDTQEQTLVDLSGDYDETISIKAPVAGRVKALYVTAGEYLQDAVSQEGKAVLLSTNGLMTATFSGVSGLDPLSEIDVSSAGTTYAATLARLKGDTAIVTFSDRKVMPGDTVQLLLDDQVLGESVAQIDMPYAVTSEEDGLISSVTAKINAQVARNAVLLKLTNPMLSKDYTAAVEAQKQAADKVAQARALLLDPVIYAQEDGIISSITAKVGTAFTANAEILSMYTGNDMQMDISVDELDIIHVKEGQSANLVMDALSDTPYIAAVSRISQLGTASAGITNYTVTLDLTKDEQLKLGMNGTATISVGEQAGLLLPLSAVQSDARSSYVWLYEEGHVQTSDEPGIKTYVTTGLSNADYAVVTSGLSQGSQVLVVRSAVNAATTQQSVSPGMMPGGMPSEGFTMPEGVTRQQFNFQRDGGQREGGAPAGAPSGN